ncbi:MAG: TIR domain-containing protein [Chloroflexota bacterium]
MDPLKVLILYGGEAATQPRNQLLDWLNSPATHHEIGRKVDARKVAEMTAHMAGSIDQRVEDMMNWADKAILLLTPDKRSEYGAPNVLEEFGRWIGQKGRETGLTLRHEEVKVHSNASGLVYVGFKNDVLTECKGRIIDFMRAPLPVAQTAPTQPAASQQTANSGPSISIGGGVETGGGDFTIGDKNTQTSAGRDINQGTINNYYYNTPPPTQDNPTENQNVKDQPSQTNGPAKEISTFELVDFLQAKFDLEEAKVLALRLKVEPEDLSSSKQMFVIDFVRHLKRRDRLDELIDLLARTREKQLIKAFGSTNLEVE